MRRWFVASALTWLSACSANQQANGLFADAWPEDKGGSMRELYAEIKKTPIAENPSLVVGVSDSELRVKALDGSFEWRQRERVDSLPAIAGSVVVSVGGSSIAAFDARTGRRLWKIHVGSRALLGAGDDGKLTVATLAHPGGERDLLLVVARDGSVLHRIEAGQRLGAPAAHAGHAFLPWEQHRLSAIELRSAKEVARVALEPNVSRAVIFGEHLYVGEETLVLVDERIGASAAQLTLPTRALPGNPQWLKSGYEIYRAGAPAVRAELFARPVPQNGAFYVSSHRYATAYLRVVFGVNALSDALEWVRTTNANLLGGGAAIDGFVLCSNNGKVELVSAKTGANAGNIALDSELRACVVQADAFRVPAKNNATPLVEQLKAALDRPDAELELVQLFLLDELVKIEESIVTKILIDVATNARTPPNVRARASTLLAGQRKGAEHMLAALEHHYDFLSEVLRPPPVGPLADALAAMDEKRAAPLLASHLNDPANSPEDVERAARALERLATPAELAELRTFFALYRATAEQEPLVRAVIHVASALLRIGGEEGRDIIDRASRDPLTHPAVRDAISDLLETSKRAALSAQ